MSVPGSANPLLLRSAGGYSISRSLRFNSSDSAYLSRTPASAGNRKTWTWAGWVKRSGFGADNELFATGSSDGFVIRFTSADIIRIYSYTGSYQLHFQTSAVYRDPSAWYHLVLAVDSTQATESNRAKLYINGVQVTAFSTAVYPSQNADLLVNAAARHDIGTNAVWGGFSYLSAYLADVHLVDGQALTPTSFGEFSATTGVWMPKKYAGTYGTNGFKLDFSDNSAATATTLGKDSSGNGNNWTPNNLSVTAGAGNDSLVDVPTNGSEVDTGAGGQVRGNYATLNPLRSAGSLSNGNLDFTYTSSGNGARSFGTVACPRSGKWYWEFVPSGSAQQGLGIADSTISLTGLPMTGTRFLFQENAQLDTPSGTVSYGTTYSSGDVIGVAYNADSNQITFYKNNVSQGAYTTTSGVDYFPCIGGYNSTIVANFGQRPFAYTAPSGFKALCTASLPAPVVTKPSTVMDVALYTGNGSTQTISGLGFSPDLVWLKARNNSFVNGLFDTVRGASRFLVSNSTIAELVNEVDGYLSAFTSDGFTLSPGTSSSNTFNSNAGTQVAWCWDAGSSTVTNTQGSISSQVRANASAGFSIVTYTGTGTANSTFGHGLGVAPSLIITKNRGSANDWYVYHASLGVGSLLELNKTNAAGTLSNYWSPVNSTVFGQTYTSAGPNNGSQVAYCFAPVAGYSSFGSYTGNGSSDGAFVYTGFRPRWVIIKNASTTSDWFIYDAVRNTYNVSDSRLYANLSSAEGTGGSYGPDILSNGFKMRTNFSEHNGSGNTIIYAAFAESPFQYARAR